MIPKNLAPLPCHLVGHVQLLADIRRIEAAAGVRVTTNQLRAKRTHSVFASGPADAEAFRAAAERLDLDVRP